MALDKNSNVSSADFWNSCYRNNDTGWDLGSPTPIFTDWCNQVKLKSKICVPGCGNGYDVLYFAQKGHDVTAIDFAKKPISKLKKESEQHDLRVNLIQKDIFSLPIKFKNKFDYIVEYTCYCAISPNMRVKYIDIMYDLLKPGGEIVAILLPINKDLDEGGPPFGINLDQTIELFLKKFQLIESIKHPLSIDPRSDKERFVRFLK